MVYLDGFDHQTGSHCGSAALRNLAEYHHWGLDEAACFGFGAGLGFELLELSGQKWAAFRPCARSFEPAFFERMRVPHRVTEETD
ncbi:BtrH N-terminal domain-containing protein [Halobium salinum]|uniref:BtrH N-terminal domain-containing protein n=1 Tax=Halobium salinum TaxID=1364940 RepID=A0ABD5PIZ0_9EURY